MAHCHQITPFVNVADLRRGIDFYERVLGFRATFVTDGVYAFLRRDEIAIRLLQIGPGIDLSDPKRQNAFYIDVKEVDALYDTLRPALDTLPPGRVRPPFDRDYGQREFHVSDEDCTLVFFGEAID